MAHTRSTVTLRVINAALAVWKRKRCGPECRGCIPTGKDYTQPPRPPAWANPKRPAGWPFVPLPGPGADHCFIVTRPACHKAGWWQL